MQCVRLSWNRTHPSQISAACRQLLKLSIPLQDLDRPHISQSQQHLCCDLCCSASGRRLHITAATYIAKVTTAGQDKTYFIKCPLNIFSGTLDVLGNSYPRDQFKVLLLCWLFPILNIELVAYQATQC